MAEEEATEEKKPKKGGSLVLIVVLILLILLLAVVGLIGYLMLQGPADEEAVAPNAANAQSAAPAPAADANKKGSSEQHQRGSDYSNIGVMFPLEAFTLNLLSDSGARYVKCTMQLEQNAEILQPEIEKKMAVIRDIVIRTLTSKTFEEVSTTKGKERLKDELVGKINEVLTDGFIKNIYFTDFVVQ